MVKRKKGRLTSAEQAKIDRAFAEGRAPEDVALELRRSPDLIKRLMKEMQDRLLVSSVRGPENPGRVVLETLRASPVYVQLRQEFDEDELAYFESEYVKLVTQFHEDVLPTEEVQIHNVLRFDIFKQRNSIRQNRLRRALERLERERDRLLRRDDLSDEERAYVGDLERRIDEYERKQSALTVEYVRCEERHQKLLESLKATREQRVDKIESGKVDFLGKIRQLSDPAVAEREDKFIELMRRAAAAEHVRLGSPQVFADGSVARPFLTPDTVLDPGLSNRAEG